MAEAGGTLRHVTERIGHTPAFLAHAADHPDTLQALWAQTELCWLNNPLPEGFKNRLLAYLGRFSTNPYWRAYHSSHLLRSGMPLQNVMNLLHRPVPSEAEIQQYLDNVREWAAGAGQCCASWPAEESADEWCIFWLAVAMFTGRRAEEAAAVLRETFGSALVAKLWLLLAYARAVHEWGRLHRAVLRWEEDESIDRRLKESLLQEAATGGLYDPAVDDGQEEMLKRIEAADRQEAAAGQLAEHLGSVSAVEACLLIMRLPVAVMIYDESGAVLAVNDAWVNLTGYGREDTPTLDEWFRKAQPDVMPPSREDIDALFWSSAMVFEGPQPVLTRDGNTRTLEFSSARLGLCASGRRAVMRVAVDVTDEVRLRDGLQRASMSLQTIISASPLGIIAMDNQDRCTLWSPAAQAIFGWRQEEVLGRQLPTIPADQQQDLAHLRRRVRLERRTVHFEGERLTRDGRRILIRAWGAPLIGADGKVEGVMALFEDITQRRRREEQAHEQAQFLEAVLRAVPVAVVAIDGDGIVRLWNPAAERIFGWSGQEAVGRPLPLIPAERVEQFLATRQALMEGREVEPSVRPCLRKDGLLVDVELLVNRVFDRSGRPTSLIGIMWPAGQRNSR